MILFALFFAGPLSSLSSPDWRERERAEIVLRRAGWSAAPALWFGMAGRCPEAAARCEAVWERLPTVGRMLGNLVDASGRWDRNEPAWDWACRQPYRTGSVGGDLLYAAEHVRRK